MQRAVSHRHSFEGEPSGSVVLDHADRHLRRKRITTSQGEHVMVDLPEAVLLADGDVLLLEDGRAIEIVAAREKLHEVRAGADVPLRHLAWHLGNRHLAAQIDEDRILIQRDHVIRDMLIGLGAKVTDTIELFQPVHGAYHHAHGHDHKEDDHGHAHGDHAHDHHGQGHHHTTARDPGHDTHGKGKPDRYGRLPGDPHYGHNHG